MTRRKFIGATAGGSAAMLIGGLTSLVKQTVSPQGWRTPPVIRIGDGKVFIDNACLQIPDEKGFQGFAEEVTKLVSECDQKYKNTKYGSEVTDRLMNLCEQLERMLEPKIEAEDQKQAAIARSKRDEMLREARVEIIRHGRATPENINEVVYNMCVKEFKTLMVKWPDLSRVYFR
jgi:ElaB/YqjD/DUF883 family membrane-anchored ribosome-binding protein